ncbi:MAG: YihY/virulence factor BrkB family protein [bacterium]
MNLHRAAVLAVKRFLAIDGAQRAAAFAYYAIFSLPSLLVLFVTVGSFFVDRSRAAMAVIGYLRNYVPLDAEAQTRIFSIVTGVAEFRGPAGAIALLALVWSSLSFFTALIRATNRAWNLEPRNWWQMRLNGLLALAVTAGALALGIAVPVAGDLMVNWLRPASGSHSLVYVTLMSAVPLLVGFYGLSLFYRLAPRRRTRFGEVWLAAALTTVALRVMQGLFGLYLANIGRLNVVYGTFGAIVALLLWSYIAGWVIILGSCLSAAQAEMKATRGPGQRRAHEPGADSTAAPRG